MFCFSSRKKPRSSGLPPIKGWFSHWADPKSTLKDFRSSKSLPTSVDVLIIGSGFSGASLAYHMIDQDVSKDIVILEARETCSGASGRNGGHLAPQYIPMFNIVDDNGTIDMVKAAETVSDKAEYIRVSQFEKDNFQAIYQLIDDLNIPCEAIENDPRGLFAVESPSYIELLKSRYELLKNAGVDLSDLTIYDSSEDVRKNTGLKSISYAIAAKTTPINPYLLVTGILGSLLETSKYLRLYTNTPVTKIRQHGSGYMVHTNEGSIIANKVVLATNGYSGEFLSKSHLIYPARGQLARWLLRPEELNHIPLVHSRISIGMDIGYLSVIPEYDDEKKLLLSVVLGGAREYSPTKELDTVDDSKINPLVSRKIREMAESVFGITGDPAEEWTGIMGFSEIDRPLIGQIDVEGAPGVLGLLGFQGHGMPRIFLSARALVERYFSDDGWPQWFPHSYRS